MATQPTTLVYTSKHLTVTVADASGSPKTATLGPGPGTLSFDGFEEANHEAISVQDRGTFMELVDGSDKEITGSIDVWMVGDLTGHSVIDAIMKTGDFSSGTTKDPGGVVWALDLTVTMTRNAVTNTFTFSNCRLKSSFKEAKEGNQFSISFTCYKGVAVT